MSLIDKLEKDYLVAYKAKDSVRLGVLRLLKTAIKNFQVEHMRAPQDDDVFDIIAKQCKQRQDSITQFTAASRPELAEKEEAEMNILCEYMPPKLTDEELATVIATLIKETGATSMKDMGKVMQALTAGYKGQFDGKAASDAVRASLQS